MQKNHVVSSLLLFTALTACDVGGDLLGDPVLPPSEVFLIPKPHEMKAASSESTSAVCATDSLAYDRVTAIIDEENTLAAADRALIEAALASTPEADAAIATYEAEIDGRTLRIEVVTEASAGSVFTGTLTDADGTETEVLSGTVDADESSGTLTMSFPDEPATSVVWVDDDDKRQVVRSRGDHEAVIDFGEDDVRLVVDDTIAWWSRTSFEGVVLDGADTLCFEGGASADDFCDITCTPELIANVSGDAT